MASSDYAPLFNKGVRDNLYLSLAEWEPTARRIYNFETTSERVIWQQLWETYGLPQQRFPGGSIAQGSFAPSFSKTFIMRYFAIADSIPEEDIEDDLYGVINRMVPGMSGAMAHSFMQLVEVDTAAWWSNLAFASAGPVAGMSDGLPLFYASHPASLRNNTVFYSNILSNVDLSVSSYQTAETSMRTQKMPNTIGYINDNIAKMVINPSLNYVARQIFGKPYQAGSADYTINAIPAPGGRVPEIIEWPYFQHSGPTGTNNSVIFLGDHNPMKFFLRSDVSCKTDYDITTNSQIFACHMAYEHGTPDWRSTVGLSGL